MIRIQVVDLWNGPTLVKGAFLEISNSNQLEQNEFLDIAKKCSKDLLALQFLDASLIAGTDHLISAAQNALNALAGKYSTARSLDVEIILYASCQHQIGVALEALGVKDGLASVALVVIAEDANQIREAASKIIPLIGYEIPNHFPASDERILRICEHFGIDLSEILAISATDKLEAKYNALKRCISSRVSMVAFET
ncbi:MAG: hypothetical protein EAX95_02430 [Candidatus Thorarchaeota archaeon]|nr:hypothetical protein [Candidatus Thorarchaeota archaeon]